MMKSVSSHLYGSLDAIMKTLGLRQASFNPTNKYLDEERDRIYQMGKLDFQTSPMFLVPMVFVIILNAACLVGGVTRTMFVGNWNEMFLQILLPVYVLLMNFAVVEGIAIRKDKGRISTSVTRMTFFFLNLLFVGSFVCSMFL